MLLGSASFATMGVLVRLAGDRGIPWQVLAVSRAGFALMFGLAWAAAARARLVWRRPATLWLRSVCGSIALVCNFFALATSPIGDVFALTNTFPLWVAVLSWPLLGERPAAPVWLAVAGGLAGVALLQLPNIQARDFSSLVALVSSLFSALAMIGLHKLYAVDHRAVVVHFSAVALAASLGMTVALPKADDHAVYSAVAWAMFVGLGLTATIGQVMLTKAFAVGPPAKVSVVALSQIGFAVIFDVVIWKRALTPATILGMLLVAAPTAWVLLHRPRLTAEELASAVAGD